MKKVLPWLVVVASLLLLGLSGTAYARTADVAIVFTRIALVLIGSIFVLVAWRRSLRDLEQRPNQGLFHRLRRWYHGE